MVQLFLRQAPDTGRGCAMPGLPSILSAAFPAQITDRGWEKVFKQLSGSEPAVNDFSPKQKRIVWAPERLVENTGRQPGQTEDYNQLGAALTSKFTGLQAARAAQRDNYQWVSQDSQEHKQDTAGNQKATRSFRAAAGCAARLRNPGLWEHSSKLVSSSTLI